MLCPGIIGSRWPRIPSNLRPPWGWAWRSTVGTAPQEVTVAGPFRVSSSSRTRKRRLDPGYLQLKRPLLLIGNQETHGSNLGRIDRWFSGQHASPERRQECLQRQTVPLPFARPRRERSLIHRTVEARAGATKKANSYESAPVRNQRPHARANRTGLGKTNRRN